MACSAISCFYSTIELAPWWFATTDQLTTTSQLLHRCYHRIWQITTQMNKHINFIEEFNQENGIQSGSIGLLVS
jgi:hypothetical protein